MRIVSPHKLKSGAGNVVEGNGRIAVYQCHTGVLTCAAVHWPHSIGHFNRCVPLLGVNNGKGEERKQKESEPDFHGVGL